MADKIKNFTSPSGDKGRLIYSEESGKLKIEWDKDDQNKTKKENKKGDDKFVDAVNNFFQGGDDFD